MNVMVLDASQISIEEGEEISLKLDDNTEVVFNVHSAEAERLVNLISERRAITRMLDEDGLGMSYRLDGENDFFGRVCFLFGAFKAQRDRANFLSNMLG